MENQQFQEMTNEDQQIEFDKAPGTSGASKGHKYEIKLVMFFLLHGKINKNIESFYLASNMDGVGAFDDLVFMYTYNENGVKKTNIIFLQAKHRESMKIINLNTLLSKAEKGDFSLKKYLGSYKEIKSRFQLNKDHLIFKNKYEHSNYLIYTNASIDFNNCEQYVEKCDVKEEAFLNLRENCYYKIKDSDKAISALRSPNSDISGEGEDVEIRGFLEKLRIFGSQFNEKELENKIIKTIKSAYSLKNHEANLIFSDVYNEVETWWLNGKMTYLTKNNIFFERAKQNVSKFSLVGLASLGRAQIETSKLNFKCDHVEKLKELIYKNQILNILTKTITLTTAKVFQVLESMPEYKSDDSEEYEYKYMFVSSVFNIQSKVIDSFESTKIKLLVLVCEYTEENVQEIYQDLFDIIEENHDKKIIMIMKENMIDTEFENIFSKTDKYSYEKYKDKTETLLNLTEVSQKKLIHKVNATLQGEPVIFGSLLKEDKIKELVDEELLSQLVNTSKINIGDPLNNLGETEKYYINRIFHRQVNIKSDFKNETSSFLVTKNSKISEKNTNNDIVLISDREDDFFNICTDENYKSNNIHWLKEEDGKLTWQQSSGSLSRLRNFIDSGNINSVKQEDMLSVNDNVVIISAVPGMGKSTILTKLAEQIKKSDPFMWVQTINLTDHTIHLHEMDLTQDKKEEAYKVLLNMVQPKPGLETELFKRRINDEGKIVLLFDGFDEISPTYNNKVINLLNALRDTKLEKLWITTRPHLRIELEEKLSVIAYTLKPLTRYDQVTFFKNFWNKRLGINIGLDSRSDLYISELLDLLKKSITDKDLEFTGVPLQTRMFAEVFQDKFNFFYGSKEEKPDLPKRLDIVDLYQKFIEKKCKIFYEEKKGTSLTKPTAQQDYYNFFPDFLRKHKILSLNLIFSDKQINELLSEEEKNDLKNFKDNFNEKDDKTGILIQILNDRPIFLHRTFAEYFAALWFVDKIKLNRFLTESMFKNCKLILIFLDRIFTKDDKGRTEYKIHNAVLNNDESEVHLLLNAAMMEETQIFDKGHRTAIHLAAAYGCENILKVLLENSKKEGSVFKDKIDTKDKVCRWSALTYAVKSNYWNIVELLLEQGAKSDDVFESNSKIITDAMNIGKETFLHFVAKKGYVQLSEVLIKNGANIIAQNAILSTPLHVAAEFGNDEVMKVLLKHSNSFNIDCEDIYGRTPLYIAAERGQMEVLKLLVDNGANINANNAICPSGVGRNWSILHIASHLGNKAIVEFLINKQVDANALDSVGRDSLYISIKEEKEEVSKLLDKTGDSSLFVYISLGKFELVKGTLKEKSKEDRKRMCNPTKPRKRGPLHVAAKKGYRGIIKLLIRNGADVSTFDDDGNTPLHILAEEGHLKIFKFLIKNGNLLNSDESDVLKLKSSGWTVLHSAVKEGRINILKFIIKKFKLTTENLEIIVEDYLKSTLLHTASLFGNLDTAKFLVENNVNINVADVLGFTPLYYAAANNHYEIVKYLLSQNGIKIYCDSKTVMGMMGFTPVALAVVHDNLDMTKLLLEKSRSFGHVNLTFPLLAAANNSITYKYLVDEGGEITQSNLENIMSDFMQIINLIKEEPEAILNWVKIIHDFLKLLKLNELFTPEMLLQSDNENLLSRLSFFVLSHPVVENHPLWKIFKDSINRP